MSKANDVRFMRLAIHQAKIGVLRGQTPFGACIVKAGRVVALCHNQVWKTTDITAHAEVSAIRQACRFLKKIDLSGCIIYSTCEPCPMCFSACHWANISKIVYGARIADAKKLGFDELTVSNAVMKKRGGARIRIQKDFMRDDCLELFSFWLKKGRRRVY
jgi:tRNA(Arg) A34 adenosine deaminase TadA